MDVASADRQGGVERERSEQSKANVTKYHSRQSGKKSGGNLNPLGKNGR